MRLMVRVFGKTSKSCLYMLYPIIPLLKNNSQGKKTENKKKKKGGSTLSAGQSP